MEQALREGRVSPGAAIVLDVGVEVRLCATPHVRKFMRE
jgi:hypothetical protein